MNHVLFKDHTNMLVNILDNSGICVKEQKYRKDNLMKIYNKMVDNNSIDNKYYNLSHEIRSFEFLNNYGNVRITSDRNSEKGCDLYLNDKIQVECVCSSSGDKKNNGLDKFDGDGVFDYNIKEQILLTRFTQSINEKVLFYETHIKDGSISKDKPYIIFLGLGNLTYGMFSGTFGFTLNKVLFGVGCTRLYLDLNTNTYVKQDYTHNDLIMNHNGSVVECNIFANNNKYNCISAIIFSTATLDDKYTKDNTFIFINPFAKNPIRANTFSNTIYWRKNKKGEYLPRMNGRDMNHYFNRNWF